MELFNIKQYRYIKNRFWLLGFTGAKLFKATKECIRLLNNNEHISMSHVEKVLIVDSENIFTAKDLKQAFEITARYEVPEYNFLRHSKGKCKRRNKDWYKGR